MTIEDVFPNHNANCVKRRMDGEGDGWANEHREALGRSWWMQDVDAMFGFEVFGQNTSNRLFMEYVPDDWENHGKVIREYGIIALFDRKCSLEMALAGHVSAGLYLHNCRVFGKYQGVDPKFFYVIGGQEPPWSLAEIDIHTGERCGDVVVMPDGNWQPLWEQLGIVQVRRELCKWIAKR